MLSFVFVPRCLSCKEVLTEHDGILCHMCRIRYDMLCHRKCRACGNDICSCDCTKEGIAAHGVWRLSKLCAYLPREKNSPIKAMLYNLKSKNNADVHDFFADEMAHLIRRKCPQYSQYTLCYVPRSTAAYKKYGYDHMQQLSYKVADKLGISCEAVFAREKISRVQKQLSREDRFENVQKSIKLSHKATDPSDRRYILLDDVCVTGASLGRCATLLINKNAREVRCFVIATRP